MARGRKSRFVLALLVGCGGLVAGAIITVQSVQLLTRVERSRGTVVKMLKKTRQQEEPVVAYRAAGADYQMMSGYASSPPSHKVGDSVTVRYDPDRPERGLVSPYFELWLIPLVCLILGVVFMAIGIFGLRPQRSTAPRT